MNNLLQGKRLLLLGGSLWKNVIKQFAEENGIVLIATGNNMSAGIFDIAEEKYNVNSTDFSSMKELIINKHIDGVYMGGAEPVINSACCYLNELSMPCYCTKTQWDFLQNKKNFKKLCIQMGLPVVPQYEINPKDIHLEINKYPVITKPSDGSGSNGFSVCFNDEELSKGYNIAKKESTLGNVIIEKFVKNKGNVVFYTVSNGIIYFSGLSDKYPVRYEKQGSYVGGLFVYESRFTDEFRKKFEEKIQKIITYLKVKEGTFWIEVFHNDNDYYFNEVGFRYGGSVSIYPTNYFYGINQVASDIYYALTGKSKIFGHSSMIPSTVPHKKYYAIYPVHLLPGKIEHIMGGDKIKSNSCIVTLLKAKKIGDIINDTGSFNQVFSLIHFVFDDIDELKILLEFIRKSLIILDSNGNDMVNHLLNINDTKFILK